MSGRRYRQTFSCHPNSIKILPDDVSYAPQAVVERLETKAGWYWDQFYRLHADKFFKDRHYLDREFPDLAPTGVLAAPQSTSAPNDKKDRELDEEGAGGGEEEALDLGSALAAVEGGSVTARPPVYLELGCGVGNTLFPAIRRNPKMRAFACDFADSAIDIVRLNPNYVSLNAAAAAAPSSFSSSSASSASFSSPSVTDGTAALGEDDLAVNGAASAEAKAAPRVFAFVADITADDLLRHIQGGAVDVATMIFVLSAVSRAAMPRALQNVARIMRPGTGKLLFRDYCGGDLAQRRLEARGGRQLGERFFARGDGTRCYYFLEQELKELFLTAGFRCDELFTHKRSIANRKRNIVMERRWVQATFTYLGPEYAASAGDALAAAEEKKGGVEGGEGQKRAEGSAVGGVKDAAISGDEEDEKDAVDDSENDSNGNGSATFWREAAWRRAEVAKAAAARMARAFQMCPPDPYGSVVRLDSGNRASSLATSPSASASKPLVRTVLVRLGCASGSGQIPSEEEYDASYGASFLDDASDSAAADSAAATAAADEIAAAIRAGAKYVIATESASGAGLWLLAEALRESSGSFVIERVKLAPLDWGAKALHDMLLEQPYNSNNNNSSTADPSTAAAAAATDDVVLGDDDEAAAMSSRSGRSAFPRRKDVVVAPVMPTEGEVYAMTDVVAAAKVPSSIGVSSASVQSSSQQTQDPATLTQEALENYAVVAPSSLSALRKVSASLNWDPCFSPAVSTSSSSSSPAAPLSSSSLLSSSSSSYTSSSAAEKKKKMRPSHAPSSAADDALASASIPILGASRDDNTDMTSSTVGASISGAIAPWTMANSSEDAAASLSAKPAGIRYRVILYTVAAPVSSTSFPAHDANSAALAAAATSESSLLRVASQVVSSLLPPSLGGSRGTMDRADEGLTEGIRRLNVTPSSLPLAATTTATALPSDVDVYFIVLRPPTDPSNLDLEARGADSVAPVSSVDPTGWIRLRPLATASGASVIANGGDGAGNNSRPSLCCDSWVASFTEHLATFRDEEDCIASSSSTAPEAASLKKGHWQVNAYRWSASV